MCSIHVSYTCHDTGPVPPLAPHPVVLEGNTKRVQILRWGVTRAEAEDSLKEYEGVFKRNRCTKTN